MATMTVGTVPRHPVPATPDIEWINARVLVPDDHLDAKAVVLATGARLDDLLAGLRRAVGHRAEQTWAPFNRARRRYVLAIGQDRAYNPRVSSLVEHRVEVPARDVVRALAPRAPAEAGPAAAPDSNAFRFRVPVTLHIPWSWPSLPMWLTVTQHSTRAGVVSLELRSRRRVRYPYRYFSAAHATLDEIVASPHRFVATSPSVPRAWGRSWAW
jgi:hypothetical protein